MTATWQVHTEGEPLGGSSTYGIVDTPDHTVEWVTDLTFSKFIRKLTVHF